MHLDSLFPRNHDVPTMRWPARLRDDEGGFTLVELIISMAIVGLLITAISGALIVSLRTTGVTNKRMAESHDVQITSAYLANDVQGASNVSAPNVATNCSGAFTPLVTFTYPTAGNPAAVYQCGTAANGETQVTRTFAGGTPVVIAHFANTARPTVTVTYDPAQPTIPVSVTMTFRKASDCTLDCTYTLFGSRRSFNPPAAAGGDPPVGDVVLLSTGASSPLWVQGKCPDPGTDPGAACAIDTTVTTLPTADVSTAGWTTTPLWNKLSDQSDLTFVTTSVSSEAKVALSPVDPPDPQGPTPFPLVELRADAVLNGSAKIRVSIYDGSTPLAPALVSTTINGVNSLKFYDWQLNGTETNKIPPSAYAHLRIGFAMTNGNGIDVYGLALDSAIPTGLLTIKGPLYVNSPMSSAVRLTGQKTAPKLSIINNGNFRIWNPGACTGCDHNTVTCLACQWNGQQPWTNYQQSIPDPLRALPAPNPATLAQNRTCTGGVCPPGVYQNPFPGGTLSPGIYYLKQGISVAGGTAVTCTSPCTGGVMLYIAGGAVSFTGSSTVNLPALSAKVFAGGLYDGIVMFQARTDTSALKFAGNSGSSPNCTMGGAAQFGNCLNGIVYVPNSTQVTLATGSASLAAKAIVAQNVKVSSSVTIG